jgi:hypothetical protein
MGPACVAVAASLAAVVTPDARAATASVQGSRLVVRGASGEANAVTVRIPPGFDEPATVEDTAVPLRPGRGCEAAGGGTVSCDAFFVYTSASLGDGDDSLVVDVARQDQNVQAFGGAGADRITVNGSELKTVEGGAGNDTLRAEGPFATMDGGPGDDVVEGGSGHDRLFGGGGRDRLSGGSGRDRLTDSDGMRAPVDADVLDGGPGIDVVSYEARREPVAADLSSEAPAGQEGEGDELRALEGVEGGAAGDSLRAPLGRGLLWGGAGDDVLGVPGGPAIVHGGDGDDRLDGGTGADRLDGGPGEDEMTGGAGDDRVAGGPDADRIDAGAGDDTVASRDNHLPSAETVRCGAGQDTVRPDWLDLLTESCEQARRYAYSQRFAAQPRHVGGRTVVVPFRCADVKPKYVCSVAAELRRGRATVGEGQARARGRHRGAIRLRLSRRAARTLRRRGAVTYHVVIQHVLLGTRRRASEVRVDWRATVRARGG